MFAFCFFLVGNNTITKQTRREKKKYIRQNKHTKKKTVFLVAVIRSCSSSVGRLVEHLAIVHDYCFESARHEV